jgi:hypothetical protein
MDAHTLLQVKMPNRAGFIPPDISQYKPGGPLPISIGSGTDQEKK